MTENDKETTQGNERIFIAACIMLAMAGAGWFYFSSAGSTKVTLISNPSGEAAQNGNEPDAKNAVKIMVHVAGNVNKPGVYELPYGSRVKDALDAAGGATSDGNADSLNLVEVIIDGQKLVVPPKTNPLTTENLTQGSGMATSYGGGMVNINTADEKSLEELPGIGPALAKRIIEYRMQKPFSSVDELKNVSGIGDKKFEQMKDKVALY